VDSKAEYSALSSTRSQKKKLKQTTPVPLWYSIPFLSQSLDWCKTPCLLNQSLGWYKY